MRWWVDAVICAAWLLAFVVNRFVDRDTTPHAAIVAVEWLLLPVYGLFAALEYRRSAHGRREA